MIKIIKLKEDKKAMEMSLNMLVKYMIGLVAVIVIVYFFIQHYGGSSTDLNNIGTSAIDGVKNMK